MCKVSCNSVSSRTSGKCVIVDNPFPLVATEEVFDENGNSKIQSLEVVPQCDSREFSIAQNVRYGRGSVFNCRITSDPVDVIERVSNQLNL